MGKKLKHAEDLRDKYSDDLELERSQSAVLEMDVARFDDRMVRSCSSGMMVTKIDTEQLPFCYGFA